MSDQEIEDALDALSNFFYKIAVPEENEELMWAANYLTYALILEQEARENNE